MKRFFKHMSLGFLLSGLLIRNSIHSQTIVAQYGDNPVVINQTDKIDNVTMITAASAERLSTMLVQGGPSPKHGYVGEFKTATDLF